MVLAVGRWLDFHLYFSEFVAASGGSVWDFLLDPEGWEQRLDAQSKELLSLSLRLRLHAPTVAIHASLEPERGPQCNTYAWLEGEFYCNPDNLKKALHEVETKVSCTKELPFGHVMGTCGPTVLVYSRTGSKDFHKFHTILEPAARSNKLVYIYRHLVENGETCPEQGTGMDLVGLGFGLELEIDGHSKESIKWEGLKLRLPSPTDAPQNYTRLGHQAIEMTLSAKNPLKALSLVTENAPLLMEHLKSVVPSEGVQERASTLTNQMPSGEALISINNLQVFTGHFEMQSLAEFALAYKGLIDRFLKPVVGDGERSNSVAREIMGLMHSSDPVRFDVRPAPNSAIVMNDLSSDKQFEAWPRTYASLMRPPTAQFYPLARNVVVMTMFLDVRKIQMTLIGEIARMLEQKVPIQVILILSDSGQPKEKTPSLSCTALYSVYRKHGRIALIALLKKLAAGEDVREAWKSAHKDLGLSPEAPSFDEGRAAAEDAAMMFSRFGITSTPTIFINGRLLEFREQGWPRDVVKVYQDEIYRLQMLIHNGELVDDKIDYYAQLMDDSKVARSRHSDLDPTHTGTYLSELPSWALDRNQKSPWLYSSKATDNCAYSVTLKLSSEDVDHLETWLHMIETTERKMRLLIEVEGDTFKDRQLRATFENLSEKRISTKEAITRLQALRGPDQRDSVESSPLVIVNGNIYGPFNHPLTRADLENLLLLEWNIRTERLQLIRLAQGLERTPGALTAMTLFEGHLRSLLGGRFAYLFTGSRALELPISKLNHFKVETPQALLTITAMVDPFSVTGAKVAALLLHTRVLVDATVILNNRHLQYDHDFRFLYRFADPTSLAPLLSDVQFSFQLLTPPAWSVLPRDIDLNNLTYRPEDIFKVEFLLDKLTLEIDTILNGRGQSGLPLILSTNEQNPTLVDQAVTITSKGYAQLAALPGMYKVQPPSIEGLSMPTAKVVLASMGINKLTLTGTTKDFLRLARLEDLLQKDTRDEGEELHALFAPESSKDAAQLVHEVLKRSPKPSSTPHLWILANLLPLSTRILLRQQLQQRASFTLFTYQWPAWLVAPPGRKNRMRALKTLFIDALPRRIRGNLVLVPNNYMGTSWEEWASLNLGEHAWAMFPYCNTTAGYWKTIEWERFLVDKPYHAVSQEVILIDATHFRGQAVGERLRTEYYRQSYDTRRLLPYPDEILINRLVHDVPILSRERCITEANASIRGRDEL